MSRRSFNTQERVALYLAAEGKCASCDCDLEPGWHADHVMPYRMGGQTDVANGQALCPRCNLKKGGWMPEAKLGAWPPHLEPREWQERARDEFESKVLYGGQRNFLCVATPGGGKTLFTYLVSHDLLSSGAFDRVVIVCHTAHLKEQWIEAGTKVGIDLFDPSNRDGREGADFHGSVVTYQQIIRAPLLQRQACASRRTLAVFDEIHHAGGDNSWGAELKEAFEPAAARLLLTGTPWRDPASEIPFVNYDAEGRAAHDFEYGYPDALADQVCRPITFLSYDGEINWQRIAGDYRPASLKDEVPSAEASRRLKVALDPQGNYLTSVFRDADAKLDQVRANSHPEAGGLIVAIDQDHARALCKMVTQETGVAPDLAISDEGDASATIERFRLSTSKWIVAVKMVSEGVDIPRLRVGLYACNVISKLFFNQVIGRFVRLIEGVDEQTAYLYLPSDERLMSFAKTIMDQQVHELGEVLEEKLKRDREDIERLEREPDLFLSGTSGEGVLDEVVSGDEAFTPEEISRARAFKQRNRAWIFIPDEIMAGILRHAQPSGLDNTVAVPRDVPQAPAKNKKDVLREERRKLSARAHAVAQQIGVDTGIVQKHVNKEVGKARDQFTLSDVKRGFEILQELLNGDATGTQAL